MYNLRRKKQSTFYNYYDSCSGSHVDYREEDLHLVEWRKCFTLCECWCGKQKSLWRIDKIEYFILFLYKYIGAS